MQTNYIGDGKVTEYGHTRDATLAEMIEFMNHAEGRLAQTCEGSEKAIKALERKLEIAQKREERRQQYHCENEGPSDTAFPASLERVYLGDGIIRIGNTKLTMSREFLIFQLDKQVMVEKRLGAENEKLKAEVFNTYRDLVNASTTHNRTLEIFLSTERISDKDFLVALADLTLPPPNEIGWNDTVIHPIGAIVAANIYGGGWGFAQLSAYEKECIGKQHVRLELERNRWYWCSLAYYDTLQIDAVKP